jgi:hypothetical protein
LLEHDDLLQGLVWHVEGAHKVDITCP